MVNLFSFVVLSEILTLANKKLPFPHFMYLVYICFALTFATNSHKNIKPVVGEKTQTLSENPLSVAVKKIHYTNKWKCLPHFLLNSKVMKNEQIVRFYPQETANLVGKLRRTPVINTTKENYKMESCLLWPRL